MIMSTKKAFALLDALADQYGPRGIAVLKELHKFLRTHPGAMQTDTGVMEDGMIYVTPQGDRDIRNNIWAGDLNAGEVFLKGIEFVDELH